MGQIFGKKMKNEEIRKKEQKNKKSATYPRRTDALTQNNIHKLINNEFYEAINQANVEQKSKAESDELQELSQLLQLNPNLKNELQVDNFSKGLKKSQTIKQ
ncbi:MAG: hypothetical protein IC227_05700 [Enterococcus lacertideformus]|uniref:Uncharacterized protein n=1 Tax=Enterococcus lacertideformus TaxID=2771493 RepID=A0A931AYX3_9ENTE|nr:hypothetical protein [Enterococcus lacertideformus]